MHGVVPTYPLPHDVAEFGLFPRAWSAPSALPHISSTEAPSAPVRTCYAIDYGVLALCVSEGCSDSRAP